MISINARDLLGYTLETIWGIQRGFYSVVCDDDKVSVNERQLIFTRYLWEIHVLYPYTPIYVNHVFRGTTLTSASHLDIFSNVVQDCYKHTPNADVVFLEGLTRQVYLGFCRLYNDMTIRLEEYPTSISALDFLDVLENPVIKEVNARLDGIEHISQADIEKAYTTITKALHADTTLGNNAISTAVKSRIVSMGQVLQSVGPRGFITDVDSHVFNKPVSRGFARGLISLPDSMMESRSAAKALAFSTSAIRDSEYNNRNIQMSSSILCNMHITDCGSTHYIPYTVRDSGFLSDAVGVFYIDRDTGNLMTVRKDDTQLIGKTIQRRSIFGCKHPDRYGVCMTCFGELGYSIPANTNVGHVSATEVQGAVGQAILSTKHEDGSATSAAFMLDETAALYLTIDADSTFLGMNPANKGSDIYFTVISDDVKNIHDLQYVPSVDGISPSRISEIGSIAFTIDRKGVEYTDLIPVSVGSRKPYFTLAALAYIKQYGWTVTTEGHFKVSLKEWDYTQPLMELPKRHLSTPEFQKNVEAFLKSIDSGRQTKLTDYTDVAAATTAAHDLISTKLKCSISHIDVIVFTFLCENPTASDYNLPKVRHLGKFVKFDALMEGRSLAGFMAHERQTKALFGIQSFINKDRPPHLLDNVFMG